MIIGIDLGTTNSACAVWQGDKAVMIRNTLGEVLTPSAVSIDAGGEVLTGIAARDRQASHHDRTATAFKRYMGTDRRTTIGGQSFRAEELSALILRSLRRDAEAFLGEEVSEAVITVPAYFNDKQRKATRRAGTLAGLKVERLINEPTAAALAYGIHEIGNETRFLVFDLGGGTFDVSILEIFEGVIEVRSSAGDNRLGGEDFNEAIIDLFLARNPTLGGPAAKNDPPLYQRMREQAERVRRALSQSDTARFELSWRDASHPCEITAAQFEAQAAPLIARLREPVLRALRDSSLRPEALDEIVLIGGSTRMPLVRRTVTRMFGRFPNSQVNPDEAVALGAAIQAGLKARDAALREVIVTDVCPYSLGVSTAAKLAGGGIETGLFSTIIERNTVIPASREDVYSTMVNNQKHVLFGIFQGEDRHVVNNVKIGELEIPMPRGPAGQEVVCRFSYDINGLLEVDLIVPKTGEKRQLVINDDEDGSDDAIEARRAALAALKVHPRDTDAVRATTARAERCWGTFLGEQRAMLEMHIRHFEGVIAGQNPLEVERARLALESVLDQLEGEAFL